MFQKLFRSFFTILGGLIGYEFYSLIKYIVEKTDAFSGIEALSNTEQIVFCSFFVLISAIIFYRFAPGLQISGRKVALNIGNEIQGTSAVQIISGVSGLVLGLLIAYLISGIYENLGLQASLNLTINIIVYSVFAFVGVVIGTLKGPELASIISTARKPKEVNEYEYSSKKSQRVPKILDTSVIIDGRILEIMKTGFLEGPIVIPEFVLVELRHIADSSDSLKRAKGRRGLDILNKIQTEYEIQIYNTDSEKALKEIPEVDVKLLKLAQIMKGKVVTNDFNLNKVAGIKSIPVLNINALSNAVKPIVIPGEKMTVTLIKQGKDREQAVAYLEDGTMIVVEDGKKHIGKTVDITVTSALQTAAGRMIFGKLG